MTKSELKAAAKEMAKVMEISDPGPPLTGTVAELQAWIKEATELVQADDEFTPETVAIMNELNKPAEDPEADNEVAEQPETDDTLEECACPTAQEECKVVETYATTDDDWTEDNGKVLEATIMSTKKLDALRQIVNDEDVFSELVDHLTEPEFNGMNGPKNLKAAMLKIISAPVKESKPAKAKKEKAAKAPKAEKAPKPAKEPKPKKEKVEKAERYSRVDAAISAIRGMTCPMTMSEIIDCANEAYSKETQTPLADPKHINNVPTLMVRTLNEFGILKKENGKYSLC